VNTLIRKIFLFLIGRAHRSKVATFAAALMALLFAQRLMAPTQRRNDNEPGRTFDGEYRRIKN